MAKYSGFCVKPCQCFHGCGLGAGGMVSIDYASQVIPKIKTPSTFRYFQWNTLESRLKSVHAFSEKYRWLLWTPFLGMVLLFMMLRRAYHVRSPEMLVVALPMGIQLVAIFYLIAGEYRYLLPFFTLPLVARPHWQLRLAKNKGSTFLCPHRQAHQQALPSSSLVSMRLWPLQTLDEPRPLCRTPRCMCLTTTPRMTPVPWHNAMARP